MCIYDGIFKEEKDAIINKVCGENENRRDACLHAFTSVLFFLTCLFQNYFPSNRPLAPQGSTRPVSDTGSPISFEVVVPSKSLSAVLII